MHVAPVEDFPGSRPQGQRQRRRRSSAKDGLAGSQAMAHMCDSGSRGLVLRPVFEGYRVRGYEVRLASCAVGGPP